MVWFWCYNLVLGFVHSPGNGPRVCCTDSLANYLGVPITENDIELPTAFLYYNAIMRYQFLERNEQSLVYRLIFDRQCVGHNTLPAPAFFNFQVKR